MFASTSDEKDDTTSKENDNSQGSCISTSEGMDVLLESDDDEDDDKDLLAPSICFTGKLVVLTPEKGVAPTSDSPLTPIQPHKPINGQPCKYRLAFDKLTSEKSRRKEQDAELAEMEAQLQSSLRKERLSELDDNTCNNMSDDAMEDGGWRRNLGLRAGGGAHLAGVWGLIRLCMGSKIWFDSKGLLWCADLQVISGFHRVKEEHSVSSISYSIAYSRTPHHWELGWKECGSELVLVFGYNYFPCHRSFVTDGRDLQECPLPSEMKNLIKEVQDFPEGLLGHNIFPHFKSMVRLKWTFK